ncbi:hypothetical protein OAG24_00135 [bacterium]|nr:hypothetical protein [bacterium]
MSYQNLTNYSGSMYNEKPPEYKGVEYDYEVPDSTVIGSPGGVDSTRHHYTKGFYGRGNTSSDIYAGQQERYISGEYGNLYNTGHTASQEMGYYNGAPDKKWWLNQPPQQGSNQPPQGPYPPYQTGSGYQPQPPFHEGGYSPNPDAVVNITPKFPKY